VVEHRHLAGVGAAQPLDHLERRRLAGAVGSEDAEGLAAADAEGDAVHGREVAVALVQPLRGDGGAVAAHGGPWATYSPPILSSGQ
jgi:hypothetical protein